MYYLALQRCAAILPGYSRAVFVQNLYGSEKKADLSCEGRAVISKDAFPPVAYGVHGGTYGGVQGFGLCKFVLGKSVI